MVDRSLDLHPLTEYTARLVEEHGIPQVLDVEHSIQVHRPTLSGASSPTSFYIRPPVGMTADSLIEWFESVPGFQGFNLSLVSILGVDTYHKPLLSGDDFAKKHFSDNLLRIVRVVGKTDQAIDAMAAFIGALQLPFDEKLFPHHKDFAVSGYQAPEKGRATSLKLLFKPADPTLLMKVERLVIVHLDECNLGREIGTSRHSTRLQPPELILTSTSNAPAGVRYLESLAKSLPPATQQDVAEATELAQRTLGKAAADNSSAQARFAQPQSPSRTLPPAELKKRAIASLAELMKRTSSVSGLDVNIVQGGMAIEAKFPRTLTSLWLATSYNEKKHIKEVAISCASVRTDPTLREGWSALYNFDTKTGKLHIRAVDATLEPPNGWKLIPFVD